MITGVTRISNEIALSRHERLGFLTFSPENLGNTIHATVQVKLEKLPRKEEKVCELTEKFGLKFVKLSKNVYEVSSKKRLGLTEFETVSGFAEGVVAIIEAENSL